MEALRVWARTAAPVVALALAVVVAVGAGAIHIHTLVVTLGGGTIRQLQGLQGLPADGDQRELRLRLSMLPLALALALLPDPPGAPASERAPVESTHHNSQQCSNAAQYSTQGNPARETAVGGAATSLA